MQYTNHYRSPLGGITMASNGTAITGLWFDGQKYFAGTPDAVHQEADMPIFSEARRWLDTYFSGQEPDFTPPLCPQGSPFRKRVWQLLTAIPYGSVATYAQLGRLVARESGLKSMSSQAIGSAVGHNPISIIIPCHRVVGSNGSLTGYAGGLERKAALLKIEGADMSKLFFPHK